ncbi:unnamed protein product [Rotaria magnacalcarata]|uniref:Uncharacterized protein n=1 Tax=Rotaria magnacalcarata TaxID=392030 RepID=A0A816AZ71_9BILA|nr:unnamed protein product [Rotaria magnacalcarata]
MLHPHIVRSNSLKANSSSVLDCGKFKNDYDILRQFPFPIILNPIEPIFNQSTATMHENDTFVKIIYIREEKVVPSSVFCLLKLHRLHIETTPFQNGIVPDSLANLKQLQYFWVYDSAIVKITERLEQLLNLSMLIMRNCSLSYLPKLNKLENLWNIDIARNQFSKLEGIPAVFMMQLQENRFNEIPTLEKPEQLMHLEMSNNPLQNVQSINSYINLESISLRSTNLTSIPSDINKLQKLQTLDLSNNKLSEIPDSLIKMPALEMLNITNNMFATKYIQAIEKKFKTSRPNAEIIT